MHRSDDHVFTAFAFSVATASQKEQGKFNESSLNSELDQLKSTFDTNVGGNNKHTIDIKPQLKTTDSQVLREWRSCTLVSDYGDAGGSETYSRV